ncbi:hypothetical protein FHS42_001815 [Streptomyces zagrosensis]|uniref:Uncharacterized protein n=1 Tax=Streptomyces zagrosensis TaxID=1042984 RepID=A0A7W9Q7S9_9ACTN|nr:hypothetical protein [Streptomyces zagrosensis]
MWGGRVRGAARGPAVGKEAQGVADEARVGERRPVLGGQGQLMSYAKRSDLRRSDAPCIRELSFLRTACAGRAYGLRRVDGQGPQVSRWGRDGGAGQTMDVGG